MNIRQCGGVRDADWLELRLEFIPEATVEEQEAFLADVAAHTSNWTAFIAYTEDDRAMGFAEVAVRNDFVNGCEHRPALFLEGIYVRPGYRGAGVARALCAAAERWGRTMGCREFASDVYIDDTDSLAAHRGLGFEETERVVYFRRQIEPEA